MGERRTDGPPYPFIQHCIDCGVEWLYEAPKLAGRRPARCPGCRKEWVRQRHNKQTREWAAANREKSRAIKRRWREANPEKNIEVKERWRNANMERSREHRRRTQKKYPLANRSYVRARRARKREVLVLPTPPSGLAARVAYFGGLCWMCGGPAEALDHVKPLSKGGAHALCNLRPACKACNSAKGAQWPFPTALRTGRP